MTLEQLYLEAARVAKLEELHGDIYPIKYKNHNYKAFTLLKHSSWDIEDIEFALAIVEGKPVFKGNELWSLTNNFKFIADHTNDIGIWNKSVRGMSNGARFSECSWNPPKPKTVMVELLVEDASYVANVGLVNTKMVQACRKALEGLKS